MPKNYRPTISHYFQRLLIEKGHVLKVYTQNIDALETIAKIPEDKLIAAHGSFEKGHCFNCKSEYTLEWMKRKNNLLYLKKFHFNKKTYREIYFFFCSLSANTN